MSILIFADHDNGQLAAATLNTVTAATQIGGDIDILVAGDASGDVAKAAAAIAGVSRVLNADAGMLAHGIAENKGVCWLHLHLLCCYDSSEICTDKR